MTPYEIISTGPNCGIVEFVKNSMSIDYLKRKMTENSGINPDNVLVDFFKMRFGSPTSANYKRACKNLADSLAAYSLVCYILQIKDRHNANIMINVENGQLVHIDFGFILAARLLNFERAPFKLTSEVITLLGG